MHESVYIIPHLCEHTIIQKKLHVLFCTVSETEKIHHYQLSRQNTNTALKKYHYQLCRHNAYTKLKKFTIIK